LLLASCEGGEGSPAKVFVSFAETLWSSKATTSQQREAYVMFFPNAVTLSMIDNLEIKISWDSSRRFSAMGFKNAKYQEANLGIGVEGTAC